MSDIPKTLIYLLVFGCAFMLMQLIIGAGKQGARKVKWANMRMKVLASADSQSEALNKLRASRGITHKNGIVRAMKWIDSMVVHSGLPLGVFGIYVAIVGTGLTLALVAALIKPLVIYVALAFVIGLVLPVFVLKFLVNMRRAKAVRQLPEALDIIVRSLRAGHPVPVALELVAREMPDPVGSEFGIANDEITYGTGLGKAMQRLAERVGHADYDLLAATIRLQERTGGNLGELLQTNAQMVRDRQKMRLKIKAASSEGRMSAMILNAAPILLYVAIQLVSPSFYGDVEGSLLVRNGLIAIVVWMVIGNLIMRKMINFRI
ncbi:MAG: type II secretion system F family protein [Acidimicrobiales bacterium]|nr:type II secretion system F family protein [Hyphomonadaceae bacterium]RZV43471.1 MAG: type II secretion system F family protein [Acidimicrobiales bacterium]